MIVDILNYGVRLLIVVLGLLLLIGYFDPPGFEDTHFIRIWGILMMLFGIYRMVMYYSHKKRQEINEKYDD